jgi:hypothetical protein
MSASPLKADIATTTWNVGYNQPPGIEPRVLTGGLFLGRCWQDGHQVGERVMAGAVMEHVPASLAEQQKHPFRWAVASNSRIDSAAMFAREINCLIAGDGHPNPFTDKMTSPRAMPVSAVSG